MFASFIQQETYMKILMVTNKVKTYAVGFQNVLETVERLGHEVIWAADFSEFIGDKKEIPAICEQINIHTNPMNTCNIRAYRQLLNIIDRREIEAVMCSTPIGGALARIAAKRRGIRPVLYEAHGFLFFNGAPFINQTVYRWEEQILAHYTDVLITITEEDYSAAQKFKLRTQMPPYMVHGAGVNVGVHVDMEREEKRRNLGIPVGAFVIVSAGELNRNKNTEVIVRTLPKIEGVHYVACGSGPERDKLINLAKRLKVEDRFHLLDYRTDIAEIMAMSDVFTIMSFREGLPRALLEAMDMGLPCVGSDIRGIRDLIDKEGGFICAPADPDAFASAFNTLKCEAELRKKMGEHNRSKVKDYSADVVRHELLEIYKEAFGNLTEGHVR